MPLLYGGIRRRGGLLPGRFRSGRRNVFEEQMRRNPTFGQTWNPPQREQESPEQPKMGTPRPEGEETRRKTLMEVLQDRGFDPGFGMETTGPFSLGPEYYGEGLKMRTGENVPGTDEMIPRQLTRAGTRTMPGAWSAPAYEGQGAFRNVLRFLPQHLQRMMGV